MTEVHAIALELHVEVAGTGGSLGHLPSLPGLSFRGDDPDVLVALAPAAIARYAAWLQARGLHEIAPRAAAAVRGLRGDRVAGLRVIEVERVAGAAVWESGNPAALLASDRRPLDDEAIRGHVRFIEAAVAEVHALLRDVPAATRRTRPAPGRRSLDETLTHVGNCIWWYCSRIDDALPEPGEIASEDPLARILRLLPGAVDFLRSMRLAARASMHVPRRFPTRDPNERWTHTKVLRRQAEHLWDHLPGIARDARPVDSDRGAA